MNGRRSLCVVSFAIVAASCGSDGEQADSDGGTVTDAGADTDSDSGRDPDVTAPTIDVTSPVDGSPVDGTVKITAVASDDAGVTSVEFYIDKTLIGSDDAEPYSVDWDTTASPTGVHRIVAKAYDEAGNVGTDDDTSVSVDNPVKPLYPLAGADWNDYVKNDGDDFTGATDTACTGDEKGGYYRCLHGGEIRAVEVQGYDDCAGLTATDALGAFDWICNAATDPVTIVSMGLKKGKGLSDLIDFENGAWRRNSVTVRDGQGEALVTSPSAWWNNPVLKTGLGGTFDEQGDVHIVTGPAYGAYRINADKVALVVEPGTYLYGPGAMDKAVNSISHDFLWIEGAVDAGGDESGIDLNDVSFSVLRNVKVVGGWYGMMLFTGFDNNHVSRITAANCSNGILMSFASNNLFQDVTVFNNEDANLFLLNGNRNNVFVGVTGFASREGIFFEWSTDNILFNGVSANIGPGIGNNGIYFFAAADNNLIVNTASVNNFASGFRLDQSGRNSFQNVASADNGVSGAVVAAFSFADSSHNYFTGVVKAGRRSATKLCYVEGGTDPGLDWGAGGCVNNGGSDATVTNDVSLAGSFAGKASGDEINLHGESGVAEYDQIEDWTHFEGPLRGWGLDGAAFPSTDHMSDCRQGETCRIWDWSIRDDDSVIRDVHGSLPTGDDTMRHVWRASTRDECALIQGAVWGGGVCSISGHGSRAECEATGGDWVSDKCSSLFLRNAVELLDDRVGNENGLCESDETCLFTPNIGSYQGHGVLDVVGRIGEDTTVERISLVAYSENGR